MPAGSGYAIIKRQIGFQLMQSGFTSYQSSQYYRITSENILQSFIFQKGVASLKDQMTINISIQPLFSPGCNPDLLMPGGRIGYFLPQAKDQWWYCNDETNSQKSIELLSEIITTEILPTLDQLATAEALHNSCTQPRYQFLWQWPSSLIQQGYICLKTKSYNEAIQTFLNNQSGKVPKFKTIQKHTELNQFDAIDLLLMENVQINTLKWKK